MSDDIALPPIDLNEPGRLIYGSKTGYYHRYPDNLLAFNGGIYVKSTGHLWSGDLDVTRDTPRLREIAHHLGEDLFILRESAYDPQHTIADIPWDKAIAIIKAAGSD
jgi:hypothetical protein